MNDTNAPRTITDFVLSESEIINDLRQKLATTQAELEAERNRRFEGNRTSSEEYNNSQKREVMLREALHHLWNERTPDSLDEAGEALAATADLDGLILCHAEEVAWYIPEKDLSTTDSEWAAENSEMCEPLYRAKEQGK